MKWYTIIHMEYIGFGNNYLPKLKYIRTKDITNWIKNCELDVQYIFEGKLKSV